MVIICLSFKNIFTYYYVNYVHLLKSYLSQKGSKNVRRLHNTISFSMNSNVIIIFTISYVPINCQECKSL